MTLSLCNHCNCMTKTITTANTSVCGKCKSIKTNQEVIKEIMNMKKTTSYTVFYNYYNKKGWGNGYLTHIQVELGWRKKLDVHKLNKYIQKEVIKRNSNMVEGDKAIITSLFKE